jgi:GT2 family glycosyltransferase
MTTLTLKGRLCAMVFKYGVKCICGMLMIMLHKCSSEKRSFQLTRKFLLSIHDYIICDSDENTKFWSLVEHCIYPRNRMELHASQCLHLKVMQSAQYNLRIFFINNSCQRNNESLQI